MNTTIPDSAEKIDSRETGLSDYVDFAHPDLFHKTDMFTRFLKDFRTRNHETYIRRISQYVGGSALIEGENGSGQKQVVMMCSADYLGLAHHPQVLAAAQEAIDRFGVSVCSVPLIAGATSLHSELEAKLARFIGADACVIFPTGQAANVGLIQALCTHRDTVVLDKLVHYSILDGVRLSGARWHSFRHSDPEHLARVLETARAKRPDSGILVVVEGVYGIDGDVPPLHALLEVCHRFGARVMVDDAHATGVLGENGRGSAEAHGIAANLPIVMGSLSKSLGSFGGFIAASGEIADYLRYYARTIAFSVGLPASCVGGAIAGLDIIQDQPEHLAKLRANIAFFRNGLVSMGIKNALKSKSAIISAPISDERILRYVAREMFDHGVYAEALPFPAVPRGQERMRFRVSAAHTQEELKKVLCALEEVLTKHGEISPSKPVGRQQQISTETRLNTTRMADTVNDPAKIAELSFKAAAAHGYPVTFLHRDDYEKVVRGQNQPVREAGSFCHFVAEGSGGLRASVCASLEPQISTGNDGSIGALGHIHWLPGEEAVLADLLAQGKQWLVNKGVGTLLAPIQTPLLHFGGGIAAQANPSVFPMLQPHLSPLLKELLQKLGFQSDISLPHWRVDLAKANVSLTPPPNPRITIRSLDKTHLLREISTIHPLISQSIAQLKYCGGFDLNALYAAAHDLRDLIIGEFWKIAEIDGKAAGFIGAFPDVNQALIESGGDAGTTDLENFGLAISAARRASIAWLGIAPEFQGAGVGHALLKSLYAELLNRNFTEAWLHWEFVDGVQRTKDFLPLDGAVIDQLDYTVFKWQS